MTQQITANHKKVTNFLTKNNLDGIVLASRANFAWFTAGSQNYVNGASETGVAALLITADACLCVTNNIESPRIATEELNGTGIEVLNAAWYDSAAQKKLWQQLIGKRKVAADFDVTGLGLDALPATFASLRFQLSDLEVQRFKDLGKIGAACLGHTAKTIELGQTEFEIAATISDFCLKNSARPLVVLVAVDERITKYRHPIPTTTRLSKMAELVLCVEQFGLIVSATRIVSFAEITDDLRKRHKAVVNIDTAMITSTIPGTKVSDVFATALAAYDANGYTDQWQCHHQGGPAGYQPRDYCATANSTDLVLANQVFAWNPSIAGTKSEDTIVTTDTDAEIISPAQNWPMIEGKWNGKTLLRPDILIR